MASLMSDIKNPFLKDYSATSLLKKNLGVLLINSQVKDDLQVFNHQYKNEYKKQKQNISTSSSISNPFSKKSLNAFDLLNQIRNPNELQNSNVRSLSQNRNMFGSIEKNMFYKGLEDLGTIQLRKNQIQKQARYQLKHFGAQTLRYQYVPTQKYFPIQSQQKLNSYGSLQKISSKFDDQYSRQTPKWNKNISSQYYGYEENKQSKEDDDFPIQRSTNKKPSLKKSVGVSQKSNQNKHSYFQNIPQDRNQDFQTAHHIKMKQTFEEQDFMKGNSNYHISDSKRFSIQNYQHMYQPESSASSGFGTPSQMYESGANFRNKFSGNKGGPLNTQAFDDQKEQEDDYDLDQFEDIKQKGHPDTLEYNNKIYYKIQL